MPPDVVAKTKVEHSNCVRNENGNNVIAQTNEQITAYIKLPKCKHNNFNIRIKEKMDLEKALKISRMICKEFPELNVTILDENEGKIDPVLIVNKNEVLGFIQ